MFFLVKYFLPFFREIKVGFCPTIRNRSNFTNFSLRIIFCKFFVQLKLTKKIRNRNVLTRFLLFNIFSNFSVKSKSDLTKNKESMFWRIFSCEIKEDIYAELFFVFSMLLLHWWLTQNCSHKHVVHLMTLQNLNILLSLGNRILLKFR